MSGQHGIVGMIFKLGEAEREQKGGGNHSGSPPSKHGTPFSGWG